MNTANRNTVEGVLRDANNAYVALRDGTTTRPTGLMTYEQACTVAAVPTRYDQTKRDEAATILLNVSNHSKIATMRRIAGQHLNRLLAAAPTTNPTRTW